MSTLHIVTPGGHEIEVYYPSDEHLAWVMVRLRESFGQYGGAWVDGSNPDPEDFGRPGQARWVPSESEVEARFDKEMTNRAAHALILGQDL